MSYNGSGVYALPGAQLVNGEIVSATENNTSRNDFAAAFNVAWTRDGQSPATGNIPMGNHKFTGLAAGTTNGDSIRYEQLTAAISGSVQKTSDTGSAVLPAGTTAQRDGSPASGYTRFNTDTGSEEYYNGTAWITVSDSATAVTLTGAQTLTNKTLTSPVINGTGVNFSDGSIQNTAATGFGFKNRLINGNMMIDQRNAGASFTQPVNAGYGIDRWYSTGGVAGKFSMQQNAGSVTPPAGFKNYLGITSLSSYTVGSGDSYTVSQSIEGFNTSDLGFGAAGASTVTLSFWVRSSLTGTFGGSLANAAVLNSPTRSYPFGFTISSANTWEQKTITVAGDTTGTWAGATNGTGLVVNFSMGVGSSSQGTANSWVAGSKLSVTGETQVVGTNGVTFYITGVQLEKGSTATSFDYRPYGTELSLCQRYCYKIAGDANSMFAYGFAISTSGAHTGVYFPVTMRATPTLSTSAASAFYTQSATNNGVPTAITYHTVSKYNASIDTSGASGLVSGEGIQLIDKTGASYLQFSAEL